MTYVKDVFGNDLFKDLNRVFIGSDEWFDRFNKLASDIKTPASNFPPYNIYKVDAFKYVIELAVAGFDKDDLSIEVRDNQLTVTGASNPTSQEYLYQGIAARTFKRVFTLDDFTVVKDTSLSKGMLRINLEKILPEHKKPKRIPIIDSDKPNTPTPQLLQE